MRPAVITDVHGAPGELWRAPMPDADDEELEAVYWPVRARTVLYGHIHRPFTRTVTAMVIANAGSAGMPWDGDPRASYLLVDDGEVEIIRGERTVVGAVKRTLPNGVDATRTGGHSSGSQEASTM